MSKQIDKYTEKEILHRKANEIIGAILFFCLIELLIIIAPMIFIDSIINRIISIAILSFILIIAILTVLKYKPNLLILHSNKRWKKGRKEYLYNQLAYCKKELLFIGIDPDEGINDGLSELNKIIIDKNDEIKKLTSTLQQNQIDIEDSKVLIMSLNQNLDDLKNELENTKNEKDKLQKEMPTYKMKVFIKSLICIFLGYKHAQNPRKIIIYDKNNGHGSNGILQKKFDLYKSKKDEPEINGLICPITGDTLEDWLKDVDIKTNNK